MVPRDTRRLTSSTRVAASARSPPLPLSKAKSLYDASGLLRYPYTESQPRRCGAGAEGTYQSRGAGGHRRRGAKSPNAPRRGGRRGRGSRGIGRGGLPDHGRLAAWTGKRSDTFLRWSRATGPARCRPQKSSSRRLAIDCEEPSRLGGRTPPFYAISATKTVMSSACGALATKVVISLSSSTTRSLAFFMHRG